LFLALGLATVLCTPMHRALVVARFTAGHLRLRRHGSVGDAAGPRRRRQRGDQHQHEADRQGAHRLILLGLRCKCQFRSRLAVRPRRFVGAVAQEKRTGVRVQLMMSDQPPNYRQSRAEPRRRRTLSTHQRPKSNPSAAVIMVLNVAQPSQVRTRGFTESPITVRSDVSNTMINTSSCVNTPLMIAVTKSRRMALKPTYVSAHPIAIAAAITA